MSLLLTEVLLSLMSSLSHLLPHFPCLSCPKCSLRISLVPLWVMLLHTTCNILSWPIWFFVPLSCFHGQLMLPCLKSSTTGICLNTTHRALKLTFTWLRKQSPEQDHLPLCFWNLTEDKASLSFRISVVSWSFLLQEAREHSLFKCLSHVSN